MGDSRAHRDGYARKVRRRIAVVWALRAAALGIIVGLWYYYSGPGGVSRLILPKPGDVVDALGSVLSGSTLGNALAATVLEIFLGFLIATVAGVGFGFWAARNKTRVRTFETMLAWGYTVPMPLFYPMFVLWFGVDIWSKVFFSAVASFFPIAYNSLRGFDSVSRTHLTVARAFGASKAQLDTRVKVPAALPMLAAGIRIGAATSMITVLFAEMLASSRGMGYVLSQFTQALATPRTFSMIIIIMVMVGILQVIVAFVVGLPTRKSRRRL